MSNKYYQDNIKELNLPDCISVEEFDKISNHGIIPEGHYLCTECFLNISTEHICPECEDINFHTKYKSIEQSQKDYHELKPIVKSTFAQDFEIDTRVEFTTSNSHCYHIRRKYNSMHWYMPQNIPVSLANHVITATKTVLVDVDTRELPRIYHGIKNYIMPALTMLSNLEPYSEKWEKVYKNVHKKVMFMYNPRFLLRYGTIQNKYLSTNKSMLDGKKEEMFKLNVMVNKHLNALVEHASSERKVNKAQFVREVLYEYFVKNDYIKGKK